MGLVGGLVWDWDPARAPARQSELSLRLSNNKTYDNQEKLFGHNSPPGCLWSESNWRVQALVLVVFWRYMGSRLIRISWLFDVLVSFVCWGRREGGERFKGVQKGFAPPRHPLSSRRRATVASARFRRAEGDLSSIRLLDSTQRGQATPLEHLWNLPPTPTAAPPPKNLQLITDF